MVSKRGFLCVTWIMNVDSLPPYIKRINPFHAAAAVFMRRRFRLPPYNIFCPSQHVSCGGGYGSHDSSFRALHGGAHAMSARRERAPPFIRKLCVPAHRSIVPAIARDLSSLSATSQRVRRGKKISPL